MLTGIDDGEAVLRGPTGIVERRMVTAGRSVTVEAASLFPPGMLRPIDPPGFRDFRTIAIDAEVPIAVTLRIVNPFGSESMRLLPVESWGTDYRLLSTRNQLLVSVGVDPATKEEGFEFKDAPPFAMIIASEDATTITLDARLPTLGPRTFTLDAGEVYRIPIRPPSSTLDTATITVAGHLVSSDKPIGLISGNLRSNGTGHPDRIVEMPGNSPKNLLFEWLPPTDRLGTTFLYIPIADFSRERVERGDTVPEVIRVVPAGPGPTEVRTSFGGSPIVVPEGEIHEFRIPGPGMPATRQPFVIRTDGPALVAVITASEGVYTPETAAGAGYGLLDAWGSSMTLLDPVRSWGDIAFVRGYTMPSAARQRVVIGAEEGVVLSIDGRTIPTSPVDGLPFVVADIELSPGDHTIRSIGGRFFGVNVGLLSGFERFAVPGTKDDGDGKDRSPAHVTEYEEILSIAWSNPITGGEILGEVSSDSIVIDRVDRCDSTVVTVDRVTENIWTLGPLDVRLDAGAINTAMTVDTIAPLGPVVGYRLLLEPIDPDLDASATVVLRGTGIERRTPFTYRARSVTTVTEIDFGADNTPGSPVTRTLTIRNLRSFVLTTLDIQPLGTPTDFSVDRSNLPRPLRPDESAAITITFTGSAPSQSTVDTLLVLTDCGEERIILRAGTNDDRPLVPLPTITGYDWQTRRIGSINDTLSFAGNGGGRDYTIADVTIIGEPSGPFSIVSPRHDATPVAPGTQRELGIRFAPAVPGRFVDTIAMTTTDGDRVVALLRGEALDTARPEVELETITLDTLCVGDTIELPIAIRNVGTTPVELGATSVIRSTNLTIIGLDPDPLGQSLDPGEELAMRMRVVVPDPGPYELLFGFEIVGSAEGTLLSLAGTGIPCAPPAIRVEGYDFGATWITTTRPGFVVIENTGRGSVTVESLAIVGDLESSFSFVADPTPFTLAEGEHREIPMEFTPPTEGSKRADVLFTTSIGDRTAPIIGIGRILVIPAFIRRDYTAAPGEEVRITIEIEEPEEAVYPGRIDWRVGYADDLLDPLGVVDSGGVTLPNHALGELSGSVNRSTDDSLSGGVLLTMRHLVRLSLLEETELPLTLESDLPWVRFVESPGLFTRLGICLLESRLFEFTRFDLEIGDPQPNPTDEGARLSFTIPSDGRTTLVLYDLLGNEVVRVIDAYLVAGPYDLFISTATLPVGTYVLRFRSGVFSETWRIDVVR